MTETSQPFQFAKAMQINDPAQCQFYHRMEEGLGRVDAAVMGMILSHVRDPFRASYNVARLCDRHLIITNQVYKGKDAVACFVPTRENQVDRVWWVFTEKCVRQMLSVM